MRRLVILLAVLCQACSTRTVQYAGSQSLKITAACDSLSYTSADSVIRPYKRFIDSSFSEFVAVLPEAMYKKKPESPLGNLCADACLDKAYKIFRLSGDTAVCCVLNYGGLRAPLPAGQVTIKNIYELMPFNNRLVMLTLDGSGMQVLLDKIAAKGGEPVSNIRMSLAAGSKYENVFIGGEPFSRDSSYILITSDYLAAGGDEYGFLRAFSKTGSEIMIRDAIADYLKEGHTSPDTGRISIGQ